MTIKNKFIKSCLDAMKNSFHNYSLLVMVNCHA